MASSEHQIKTDIKDHMAKLGGKYMDWYVGITADPRTRLFEEHGVDEESDAWIFSQANSSVAARRVEEYFVDTLGTDGGRGGGDQDTDYVYAYKKQAHTNP